MKQWIKAIILLPFNVLVVIPGVLLYFTKFHYQVPSTLQLFLGGIFLVCGAFLAGWTMMLFHKVGKGTPAPWAAPKHLVTEGPYKFVRNPMIVGVLLLLIAEAFILNTRYIFYWAIAFFVINCIYFKLFEEKQLKKTFGAAYLEYKKNVPMWLPKWK